MDEFKRFLPRDKCELFSDNMVCLESALRRNSRVYRERERVLQ